MENEIDWSSLLSFYNCTSEDRIAKHELVFMFKDLMNLRDGLKNHTIEDAAYFVEKYFSDVDVGGVSRAQIVEFSSSKLCTAEKFNFSLLSTLHNSSGELRRLTSIEQACLQMERDNALRDVVGDIDTEDKHQDPDPAMESAVEFTTCEMCTDDFNVREVYGAGLPCEKRCPCTVRSCLQCIRRGARVQIQAGRHPTCPGRRSIKEPCPNHLDSTLLALLYKNECSMCGIRDVAFVQSGCGLEHKFCASCLREKTLTQLQTMRRVPKCPRFSECRYVFDEIAMRNALDKIAEVDTLMLDWHDLFVQALQGSHPLSKACSEPNCQGFLRATPQDAAEQTGASTEVLCSDCHTGKCWRCLNPPHPKYLCSELAESKMKWVSFLRTFVADDGTDKEAFARAYARFETAAADNEYFSANILLGNMKRCPNCQRLIEKMQGCDTMVCGRNADGGNEQNGCGHRFSWSSVPRLAIEDVDMQKSDVAAINISDPHYDNDVRPIAARKCTECKKSIIGTRFVCVFCVDDTSLCLSCVKKHITPDTDTTHKDHVFEPIDPPMHSMKALVFELESSISSGSGEIIKVIEKLLPLTSGTSSTDANRALFTTYGGCTAVSKLLEYTKTIEDVDFLFHTFQLVRQLTRNTDFRKLFVSIDGLRSFVDVVRLHFRNPRLAEIGCMAFYNMASDFHFSLIELNCFDLVTEIIVFHSNAYSLLPTCEPDLSLDEEFSRGIDKIVPTIHPLLKANRASTHALQKLIESLLDIVLPKLDTGFDVNPELSIQVMCSLVVGELIKHMRNEMKKNKSHILLDFVKSVVTEKYPILAARTTTSPDCQAAISYVAEGLEYLVAEVLELGGNACKDDSESSISKRHIISAVEKDDELRLSLGKFLDLCSPDLLATLTQAFDVLNALLEHCETADSVPVSVKHLIDTFVDTLRSDLTTEGYAYLVLNMLCENFTRFLPAIENTGISDTILNFPLFKIENERVFKEAMSLASQVTGIPRLSMRILKQTNSPFLLSFEEFYEFAEICVSKQYCNFADVLHNILFCTPEEPTYPKRCGSIDIGDLSDVTVAMNLLTARFLLEDRSCDFKFEDTTRSHKLLVAVLELHMDSIDIVHRALFLLHTFNLRFPTFQNYRILDNSSHKLILRVAEKHISDKRVVGFGLEFIKGLARTYSDATTPNPDLIDDTKCVEYLFSVLKLSDNEVLIGEIFHTINCLPNNNKAFSDLPATVVPYDFLLSILHNRSPSTIWKLNEALKVISRLTSTVDKSFISSLFLELLVEIAEEESTTYTERKPTLHSNTPLNIFESLSFASFPKFRPLFDHGVKVYLGSDASSQAFSQNLKTSFRVDRFCVGQDGHLKLKLAGTPNSWVTYADRESMQLEEDLTPGSRSCLKHVLSSIINILERYKDDLEASKVFQERLRSTCVSFINSNQTAEDAIEALKTLRLLLSSSPDSELEAMGNLLMESLTKIVPISVSQRVPVCTRGHRLRNDMKELIYYNVQNLSYYGSSAKCMICTNGIASYQSYYSSYSNSQALSCAECASSLCGSSSCTQTCATKYGTRNEFDPLLLEVLKSLEVLVSCGFQCDTSQVSPELIKALRMLRDTQKQNIASTIEIRGINDEVDGKYIPLREYRDDVTVYKKGKFPARWFEYSKKTGMWLNLSVGNRGKDFKGCFLRCPHPLPLDVASLVEGFEIVIQDKEKPCSAEVSVVDMGTTEKSLYGLSNFFLNKLVEQGFSKLKEGEATQDLQAARTALGLLTILLTETEGEASFRCNPQRIHALSAGRVDETLEDLGSNPEFFLEKLKVLVLLLKFKENGVFSLSDGALSLIVTAASSRYKYLEDVSYMCAFCKQLAEVCPDKLHILLELNDFAVFIARAYKEHSDNIEAVCKLIELTHKLLSRNVAFAHAFEDENLHESILATFKTIIKSKKIDFTSSVSASLDNLTSQSLEVLKKLTFSETIRTKLACLGFAELLYDVALEPILVNQKAKLVFQYKYLETSEYSLELYFKILETIRILCEQSIFVDRFASYTTTFMMALLSCSPTAQGKPVYAELFNSLSVLMSKLICGPRPKFFPVGSFIVRRPTLVLTPLSVKASSPKQSSPHKSRGKSRDSPSSTGNPGDPNTKADDLSKENPFLDFKLPGPMAPVSPCLVNPFAEKIKDDSFNETKEASTVESGLKLDSDSASIEGEKPSDIASSNLTSESSKCHRKIVKVRKIVSASASASSSPKPTLEVFKEITADIFQTSLQASAGGGSDSRTSPSNSPSRPKAMGSPKSQLNFPKSYDVYEVINFLCAVIDQNPEFIRCKNVVKISGASVLSINGIYEPMDECVDGISMYKMITSDKFICYNSLKKHWIISDTKGENAKGFAYVPSPFPVPLERCVAEEWCVHKTKSFTHEPKLIVEISEDHAPKEFICLRTLAENMLVTMASDALELLLTNSMSDVRIFEAIEVIGIIVEKGTDKARHRIVDLGCYGVVLKALVGSLDSSTTTTEHCLSILHTLACLGYIVVTDCDIIVSVLEKRMELATMTLCCKILLLFISFNPFPSYLFSTHAVSVLKENEKKYSDPSEREALSKLLEVIERHQEVHDTPKQIAQEGDLLPSKKTLFPAPVVTQPKVFSKYWTRQTLPCPQRG